MKALSLMVAMGAMADRDKIVYKLRQLTGQLSGLSMASCEDGDLYADTVLMARFLLEWEEKGLGAALYWSERCEESSDDINMRSSLLFCAGIFFRRLASKDVDEALSEIGEPDSDTRSRILASVTAMCGFCKKCADRSGTDDWFAMFAAHGLMQVMESWPSLSVTLSEKTRASVRRMDVRMSEQRSEYEVLAREAESRQRGYDMVRSGQLVSDGAAADGKAPDPSIPMLTVNLFGGMEVRIGGKLLEPGRLTRLKAKTLLAILVVNRGKEISRQRLSHIMWPEAGVDAYRRNFYSLWSQLKHALSLAGSCPYLRRSNAGCSVDARLVSSDVYDYERVCRSLLFGGDESGSWEQLYACVTDQYAEELMPCETENETIVALRERYHAQLIDGLIATSARLVAMGEPRGALWFAREASLRESKREDVFIALMEAQIASDQRSAALETYFECRKFLSEELGIDPSARLIRLYRSIIETEDVF